MGPSVELYEGCELDLFELGDDGGRQVARWAGLDGEDTPDPGVSFVRASNGRVRPALATELLPGEQGAYLPARGDEPDEIAVRRGLTGPWFLWTTAHEGGHYVSCRLGYRLGDFEEAFASIAGRSLIMPRRAIARVWSRFADPRRVFEWWDHVPPLHVALRLGEARVLDVWLATRRKIVQRRAEEPAEKAIVLAVADQAIDRGEGECVEARGYLATALPENPGLALVIGPRGAFGF